MKYIFYDLCGANICMFIKIYTIFNTWYFNYIFKIIAIVCSVYTFAIIYTITATYNLFFLKRNNHTFLQLFHSFVEVGFIYSCIFFSYLIMKLSFFMQRPCCNENFSNLITQKADLNFASINCFASFPSAHTGMAVLISYIFLKYRNGGILSKLLLFFLIILTGISRITLAMHYPIDVIYSIAIAWAICVLADKIINTQYVKNNITQYIGKKI